MKAIMISIKPKWVAKILNGEKTIEIRKNKALAKAIQILIDKYGYAMIYVYCSMAKHIKDYPQIFNGEYMCDVPIYYERTLNGKVPFKFRCCKVEEILNYGLARRSEIMMEQLNKYAPHKEYDDDDYIYVIHISYLEIFDRPRELCEFYPYCKDEKCEYRNNHCSICYRAPLTKAPQNYQFIEVE